MPQNNRSVSRTRLEIARLAARFVAENGVNDYLAAKRKAAQQLGLSPDKNMPTNLEIEQALIEYQGLFQRDTLPQLLQVLRGQALRAMRLLEDFQPRLSGPVLTGTATSESEITLHLVSDEPESVAFVLAENAIPYRSCEKSIKLTRSDKRDYPAFQFMADKARFVLIVFPERQRNQVPISSITGKPMQRASMAELEQLVNKFIYAEK